MIKTGNSKQAWRSRHWVHINGTEKQQHNNKQMTSLMFLYYDQTCDIINIFSFLKAVWYT